jgi:hypothetical protein
MQGAICAHIKMVNPRLRKVTTIPCLVDDDLAMTAMERGKVRSEQTCCSQVKNNKYHCHI